MISVEDFKVLVRLTGALERLADAAMIAARAYEYSIRADFDYEPEIEEDED